MWIWDPARMDLRGAHTALVTPFKNGNVDVEALRALVERQIEGGISGLVPCGTTGESVALSAEEHLLVIKTVVEQANGRVPIFGGAGTNATAKSIALAELTREAGADGLLVVCPYYNKPTQAGLVAHFAAIANAVPMPVMLYNVPSRTGCDLSVDSIATLAKLSNVVAIKEASGNILKPQQIAARVPGLTILSGDDVLSLGTIAVGGQGVVSVASNFAPASVSEVMALALKGDFAAAKTKQLALLPLYEALFAETNPGPIKALMAHHGFIENEIRGPMAWPEADTIARVVKAAAPFAPSVVQAASQTQASA